MIPLPSLWFLLWLLPVITSAFWTHNNNLYSAMSLGVVGYDRSTERADSFLLPTLQKAFGQELTSYEIVGDRIVQPNAVGFKLRLPPNDKWPSMVFLKQVLATDYVDNRQDWSDLRRTLLYARTELRFYRDVLPLMQQKGFHDAPQVYYAYYDFEGWIPEGEHATTPADPSVNKDLLPDPLEKGGWLVLECISDKTHTQDSPLTMEQARKCLKAAAELHASAWQEETLLQKANDELSRAAFHLQMRNPKELAGIETAWTNFLTAFRKDLEANGLWTPSVQNLGQRIKGAAESISNELTLSPNDQYATVIHGDYKAMNVMLGLDTAPTIMLDFASASCGMGMSDVAMHIHHAVTPKNLDNGGEEALLDHYLQTLRDLGCDYPEAVAKRHYKLAVIDYARFFLPRWKNASPESMEKNAAKKNVGLINRSVTSALRFIKVVDQYLTELEESRI